MLKPAMRPAFFEAVFPHLDELREILMNENDKNVRRYKDLDWRLNLVVGCRAR